MKNIYMIGNTHFDPVWLWKWDEAMASIHSTFRSALDRMKEDDDFIYSFDTPPVFEWIKNTDPEMFEEIKMRVDEGRWELCEGWWLQPDCFSACGESYARQSLYGQRYLKENFGRYADTVFNIDSFGHNSATPQILKKSNIDYYCMCRPENGHFPLAAPYFKWESKDGSFVNAFRAGQYSPIYNKDMEKAVKTAEENMHGAVCDEMMVYGVTNHGGAPTKKAIADIHALSDKKDYDIKFSSVSGYFKAQKRTCVTVEGEMITNNYGPYTNNHLIKKRNRIAEYAVVNAEKASVIAKKVLNKKYEKKKLNDCWKAVMFNQFHDILGGASIRDAYFDAYNQLGGAIFTANEMMHFALQSVTGKIKTPGVNPDNPWNIVVWNLNDTDYDGFIEAEVQWLHEFDAYSGGILLKDSEENEYPCQIILEKSVIAGFRSRFVFKANIPAFGYKSFKVIKTDKKSLVVENNCIKRIDNGVYEVDFDEKTGFIKSVFAKNINKEFKNILKPECFSDEGDTWCFNTVSCGEKLEDFELYKLFVTEDGMHRTTVKATYKFRKSWLTLYYTFYDAENYFDIKYSVNWNEEHTALKLMTDTGYSDITVSSPFSTEQRTEYTHDVPMGEWVCMHDNDGGVSFICDSIFSYTKTGTVIGLNILRSCIYGDLRLCELNADSDYPIMEQGICEGCVRVVLHDGDYAKNKIPAMANAFNNNPVVICEANHDGVLPEYEQYIGLKSESVYISAVKECEADEDNVIRLFEISGKKQNADLNYFGNVISIPMNPYEIKTVKISGDEVKEVNILEE